MSIATPVPEGHEAAPVDRATAQHVDGRRARGDNTHRAILRRAMQIASVDGLEGLSLAGLASELDMSKSGLFAHFGSKEQLQLSTLRAARRVFADEAIAPVADTPEGVRRLAALLGTWFGYISTDTFAGGCIFMHAAAEFDSRPGKVRDLIAETMRMFIDLLVEQVRAGVERDELEPDTDPEQLAWELHAFGLALNWDHQLYGGVSAAERAQVALESRLSAAATKKGRKRLASS
jgi:AcrR family transcriptional regulator